MMKMNCQQRRVRHNLRRMRITKCQYKMTASSINLLELMYTQAQQMQVTIGLILILRVVLRKRTVTIHHG